MIYTSDRRYFGTTAFSKKNTTKCLENVTNLEN